MSYTYTEQKGDGATRTFPFGFAGEDKGYIRATDIVVETAVNGQEYQPAQGWSLTGTNQVTFLVAPAADLNIRIRRVVDKDKPFAKFDRSVTLDMLSLNNTFIQMLQVVQEIMDGFFPANFFFKGDINMGGHRVVNLGPALTGTDAINKNQLDVEAKRNDVQDQAIASLKSSLTAGTANRTVPWMYTAVGGETTINPPFVFDGCLVYIQGIHQFEEAGAYVVQNNQITFAEPLKAGWQVKVYLGSRMAPPVKDESTEYNIDVAAGVTTISLPDDGGRLRVYLDGLRQPLNTYSVAGRLLTFTESLPACTVTVEYTPIK